MLVDFDVFELKRALLVILGYFWLDLDFIYSNSVIRPAIVFVVFTHAMLC